MILKNVQKNNSLKEDKKASNSFFVGKKRFLLYNLGR